MPKEPSGTGPSATKAYFIGVLDIYGFEWCVRCGTRRRPLCVWAGGGRAFECSGKVLLRLQSVQEAGRHFAVSPSECRFQNKSLERLAACT